jgi:hypothetical protein
MATVQNPSDKRRNSANVSANKTLAQDADMGLVQNVIADGKTITLPAAAAGLSFTIRNGGAAVTGGPTGTGADGTVAITIAPNGTDTIGGAGRTSANTNFVNTKATSQVGDQVTLSAVAGKWLVTDQIGTWA